MTRKSMWVLVSVLVIVGLLIGSFGCAPSGIPPAPPTPTPPTPALPPAPAPPAPTPTPTPGATLGEILGRAAGIASMKYDLVMTGPGVPTMTQKIWVKKNKMRTEMTQQGQTQVILIDIDARTMYMYMPEQNLAMKIDFSPTTKSAVEEAKSIQNYNPTVVGTETIDGKVCLVVEYTVEGATTKAWIWEEYGFPIRMEVMTTAGKATVEYKNIEFVDIPDSMFELPPDVEIIQQPGS